MLELKDIKIMTVEESRLFLQIEKNYCGPYTIKACQYVSYEFITIVVEMLQNYGDVFAAYVESINPHLSINEKEILVKIFPTTIKDMEIIVTKTDDSHLDHDWGSCEVNNLDNLDSYIEYQGHLYLFSRKPK